MTAARQALINSLQVKLDQLKAERATFTLKSKAARAVALDAEITTLANRIVTLKLRADKATVVDNDTGTVHTKTPLQEAVEQLQSAQSRVLEVSGTSSMTRYIASMVTTMVVGAVTGWAAYTAVNWITAAAMLLTGSAFLAFLVYILGTVLSLIVGVKAMSGSYNYVADGVIDSHVGYVKSWFGVKREQAKAMFAGEPSVAAR